MSLFDHKEYAKLSKHAQRPTCPGLVPVVLGMPTLLLPSKLGTPTTSEADAS